MRSDQPTQARRPIRSGIISACAERSGCPWFKSSAYWDHLRVCGAIPTLKDVPHVQLGSSPRVRSDPHVMNNDVTRSGIISACAERSSAATRLGRLHRGSSPAIFDASRPAQGSAGSSPRVRSDRRCEKAHGTRAGIISACAERSRGGYDCTEDR